MHPNLITTWRKKARQKVLAGFSGTTSGRSLSGDRDQGVAAKIGELVIERDFFVEGLRSLSPGRRVAMVAPQHAGLSITRQCRLVSITRSSFYYASRGDSPLNLRLMRRIDEAVPRDAVLRIAPDDTLATPPGQYGLAQAGAPPDATAGGARALPAAPDVSAAPGARIYPYLLRDLQITRPNHVWCTDVTYIPLRRGFLYLVAVMDWASRKVLSWRLSNTLDAHFCVEAFARGASSTMAPQEIFNSDQGSQFTSVDFTDVLTEAGIRISMDGKGRWMDNVFIERLWRSLKYECVHLSEFATGAQGPDRHRLVDGLLRPAPAPLGAQRPDAGRGVY